MLDTVEIKPFYYLYMYPNGAFPSVQEMDVAVSLFDAQWLGAFALNPSVLMAWEFDNTALGTKPGTYAEVDINPNWVIYQDDTYPVSLAVPDAGGHERQRLLREPDAARTTRSASTRAV